MRKRFNFWLDDKNKADWQVNDLITALKGKGQFTRAIREGVRLWVACRDNDPAVLCELFPKLAEKLGATIIEKPVPPATGGAGQLDEIKSMLEMVVSQQAAGGYVMKSAQPQPVTGKPLTAKSFDLPVFEDDDEMPTIALSKNMSNDANKNFLGALAGLR